MVSRLSDAPRSMYGVHSSLKMGLQMEVSLVMNQLMYYSQPRNPFISFSLLGGCVSKMDFIFDGLISIPLSHTRKPSNFQAVTLNVHFCLFNLSLYSLIISNNFLKLIMWPSLSLDFTIMSST